MLASELIQRFDIAGPRYTSYPTADRFYPDPQGKILSEALGKNQRQASALSLYIHIPFCESVCYYCGCNKIVTKNHAPALTYLKALCTEIDLVVEKLNEGQGGVRPVAQVHLGGGSPTFLSDEQLGELFSHLRYRFDFDQHCEISIEVDPRTINKERLRHFKKLGVTRLSFGVQDFDEEVQVAIHRLQPYSLVASLMDEARSLAFDSINLDLIYGLPKQTSHSFAKTLAQVVALRPDRLALYAYAHLPQRFKPQRRIHEEELPDASDKCAMLDQAVNTLLTAGYDYIGMDHFALPHDALSEVKRRGELQRNFQGYHTLKDADLLGLGVSAISEVGSCYSQNHKTLEAYTTAITQGLLPIEKALALTEDDLLRREVIMALMCQGQIDIPLIEKRYAIHFRSYFAESLKRLEEFIKAGLLQVTDSQIKVSQQGWFVIRAIAMAFDQYLWQDVDHRRFSKVL